MTLISKLSLSLIVLLSFAACTKERTTNSPNQHVQNLAQAPDPSPAPVTDPTPLPSPVVDPTPLPTATPVTDPTAPPVPTATPTATPKPTPAPTATPSATPKPTPTAAPSATPKPTPTASPMPSPAADCGEIEITLAHPVDSFNLDVYRAHYFFRGEHVHGKTYWGNHGHIDMDFSGGIYHGVLGFDAPTDLACATSSCKGVVNGRNADITFIHATNGGASDQINGDINGKHLKITRTRTDIFVEASNGTKLHVRHTRRGHWEGHAIYYDGLNRLVKFSVVLETRGSMTDIPDNIWLALTVGAPLTLDGNHW